MVEWIRAFFLDVGLADGVAMILTRSVALVAVLLLSALAFLVAKSVLLRLIHRLAARTQTNWDNKLVEHRVFFWVAHLAPAIIVYGLAPGALEGLDTTIVWVTRAALVYMVVVGLLAADALLNAALAIYNSFGVSRNIPLKSFFQVAKLILYVIAVIVVLAMILGKSPLYLLSGMGVLASVMMLVFKDPILGFVGGIQLSANRMLAKGDWIEMPSHGADGDVIDIALTTVKVQNWDKTITTIPTYALISESFKNWRGMSASGGRRIKRSVYIDISSIKLCTPDLIERFSKIQHIAVYVEAKHQELAAWNQERGLDMTDPVNARRLTNVGTFRAYILAYLKNHPRIHQGMTLLVRQLEPGPNGLPIEIYCFTNDTRWEVYEDVQADIFDHILAIAPEFELSIRQNPSGSDLRRLGKLCTSLSK